MPGRPPHLVRECVRAMVPVRTMPSSPPQLVRVRVRASVTVTVTVRFSFCSLSFQFYRENSCSFFQHVVRERELMLYLICFH